MDPLSDFLSCISEVVGLNPVARSLHEPRIGQHELSNVSKCLESTFVSTVGPFTSDFEHQLESMLGVDHVIAVVNGTAALHISLIVAGVDPGDEVVIPSLSFVATANAVKHAGAIPHFVDSENTTLGLSPISLREMLDQTAIGPNGSRINRITGRKIAAIVPMHTFGHIVNIAEIMLIAAEFNVTVIEDAAESLGSTREGQHAGTFGDLGTLSFNGNKILTTGGGGAVVTRSDEIATRIRALTTTAKRTHPWEFFHDEVAWNYRMPNLNASLGLGQLADFSERLEKKRELAFRYKRSFANSEYFDFVGEPDGCTSNYWLNSVRMKERNRDLRNAILDGAVDAGFGCRPAWNLLSTLPMFVDCPVTDLSTAQELEDRLICLPSSPQLVDRAEAG
jgi:perosamine synthetase